MTIPESGPLFGVWGTSPSDVFAVGDGTILHYDGSSWSEMNVPEIDGVIPDFTGVWGASSSDVFAVGPLGVIVHYGP